MNNYVPEQGDFVWINMNPQLGHEQAGRRPAIILSPVAYNKKVDMAILCPVTNQIKGYPFIGKAPETTIVEVLKKLNTLIHIQYNKLYKK